MKIRSAAAAWLIFISLALCLFGCNQQAPAPTEENTSIDTYVLSYIDSGMIGYNAADFQIQGALELKDDGTARLHYDGAILEFCYDSSNMWTKDAPEELYPYTVHNGRLTLQLPAETLVFQKQ